MIYQINFLQKNLAQEKSKKKLGAPTLLETRF